MKIIGRVSLEEIDARLGGALQCGPGEAMYCNICDGLRPIEHDCVCAFCRSPEKECRCGWCEAVRGDEADLLKENNMPQKMSATAAKSMCMGAGAPEPLMESLEAAGFSFSDLWPLLLKLSSFVSWDKIWPALQASMVIWSDASKTMPQKLLAIAELLFSLIPSTGSAPA